MNWSQIRAFMNFFQCFLKNMDIIKITHFKDKIYAIIITMLVIYYNPDWKVIVCECYHDIFLMKKWHLDIQIIQNVEV